MRQSALHALQTYKEQDETRVRLLIALACGRNRLGETVAATESNREALRLANEINDVHLVAYAGTALAALLMGDPAHAQEAGEVLRTSLIALGSDPSAAGELRVLALEELHDDLYPLAGTNTAVQ